MTPRAYETARPPKRKRIDWDAQPLGQVSDSQIARTLGVTQGAVSRARTKRGIPSLFGSLARSIDWEQLPLGQVPDGEIARQLGVPVETVAKARRRRGGTKQGFGAKGIDWDQQPLGQVSDSEIARRVGTTPHAVANARKRRGIELPPRPPRVPKHLKCKQHGCNRRRAPGKRRCAHHLALNLATVRRRRGIPLDAPVGERRPLPSVAQQARAVGLTPAIVAGRRSLGWSLKRALSTPAERTNMKHGLQVAEEELRKRNDDSNHEE